MSWWKTAIYDTCSLITLDKLLEERRTLSRYFPKKVLALEVSLSADQMYEDTAERMKELVEICDPPPLTELASLLSSGLPKSLSDVDKLVFATAVVTLIVGAIDHDRSGLTAADYLDSITSLQIDAIPT